jgi:hypothetical protein
MGFQSTSFSLVVEGKRRTSTQCAEANCGRLPNFPVAWSTLLKGLVFKMEPSNLLSYYVHFQIQHASCFKNLVWPSRETCTSNPSWLRKFNQIEGHDNSGKGRQFEILMVTHNHPVRLSLVLKLERAINGHCMLKLFCFPFASALLERALHQMSAAISPWPTYRLILGIVE